MMQSIGNLGNRRFALCRLIVVLLLTGLMQDLALVGFCGGLQKREAELRDLVNSSRSGILMALREAKQNPASVAFLPRAIAESPHVDIPTLISGMRLPDGDSRDIAVRALGFLVRNRAVEQGERATLVPELYERLNDRDATTRTSASIIGPLIDGMKEYVQPRFKVLFSRTLATGRVDATLRIARRLSLRVSKDQLGVALKFVRTREVEALYYGLSLEQGYIRNLSRVRSLLTQKNLDVVLEALRYMNRHDLALTRKERLILLGSASIEVRKATWAMSSP